MIMTERYEFLNDLEKTRNRYLVASRGFQDKSKWGKHQHFPHKKKPIVGVKSQRASLAKELADSAKNYNFIQQVKSLNIT